MGEKILSTAESMEFFEQEDKKAQMEEENLSDFAPSPSGPEGEQLPPRIIYRASESKNLWRKCAWGLDIGAQTIKVIGLRKGMRKTHLVYMAIVDIAPGRKANKQDINEQARVAAILNALEGVQLDQSRIITCLDRASVLIRQIQYPAAARDKLLSALQWEVRKYIPFKPNEVVVDAQVIEDEFEEEEKSAEKDKLDILLVAATNEHLNQHTELMQRIGIKADLIDASPLALMNVFMALREAGTKETALILDLGATATTLNVLSSKGYYFTLSLSVGGTRFSSEIQSHCQVEYDLAEDLKMGKKPEEARIQDSQKLSVALQAAMEKNYDLLVKEIRQALIYFNKQTGINDFDRMVLTGGGASLTGLSNYLLQKTGIKTEIFNPLTNVEVDPKCFDLEQVNRFGPQMALSMGLALRGLI